MRSIYVRASSISQSMDSSTSSHRHHVTVKFTFTADAETACAWVEDLHKGVHIKRDIVEEELIPVIVTEYNELQRAYDLLKKANLDLQARYDRLKEKMDDSK